MDGPGNKDEEISSSREHDGAEGGESLRIQEGGESLRIQHQDLTSSEELMAALDSAIKSMHYGEGFSKLRHLEITHNAGLERLEISLGWASALQTLVLSHNSISRLAPLDTPGLSKLVLSHNHLRSAANIEHLSNLKTLDLSHNDIAGMLALRPLVALASSKNLTTVHLAGNPVSELPRYWLNTSELLPCMVTLDGVPIRSAWSPRTVVGNKNRLGPPSPLLRLQSPLSPGHRRMIPGSHGQLMEEAPSPASWHGGGSPVTPGVSAGGTIPAGDAGGARSVPSTPCTERSMSAFSAGSSRPPSPARQRQMDGDTARAKPSKHWDVKYHARHQQLQALRSSAHARTNTPSPKDQRGTMDRLAKPLRVFRLVEGRVGQIQATADKRPKSSSSLCGDDRDDRPVERRAVGTEACVQRAEELKAMVRDKGGGGGSTQAQLELHSNDTANPKQFTGIRTPREHLGSASTVGSPGASPAQPGNGTRRRASGKTSTRLGSCRVFKTSLDFSGAMGSAFQVEMSEEQRRELYQALDVDKDGALGAEDILRGMPLLAAFVASSRSLEHRSRPGQHQGSSPSQANHRSTFSSGGRPRKHQRRRSGRGKRLGHPSTST